MSWQAGGKLAASRTRPATVRSKLRRAGRRSLTRIDRSARRGAERRRPREGGAERSDERNNRRRLTRWETSSLTLVFVRRELILYSAHAHRACNASRRRRRAHAIFLFGLRARTYFFVGSDERATQYVFSLGGAWDQPGQGQCSIRVVYTCSKFLCGTYDFTWLMQYINQECVILINCGILN